VSAQPPRRGKKPARSGKAAPSSDRRNTVEGVHVLSFHVLPLHVLPLHVRPRHGTADDTAAETAGRRSAVRPQGADAHGAGFAPGRHGTLWTAFASGQKRDGKKIFFPVIFPVLRETRRPGNRTDDGRPYRLPICAAHTRSPHATGQPPPPRSASGPRNLRIRDLRTPLSLKGADPGHRFDNPPVRLHIVADRANLERMISSDRLQLRG
jgi:hypothetical protein